MKRNRQEVIKLSDDEASEDRRAGKSVRKEDESASLQEVIELRQRVTKLDKDLQGTRRIARGFELKMEEQQKRVDFLEDLLDKKPGVTDNAEYNNLLAELKRTREKVNSLTEDLIAKTKRANEDQARNAELTRKVAEAEKREKRKAKEHQDKLAEISRRFEEARREAESELSGVIASLNEEIVRERSQVAANNNQFNNRFAVLLKQLEEARREAANREKELQDSAVTIESLNRQITSERSQASLKEKQSGTRFAEISRQLQDGKRDAARREGELLKKNAELHRQLAQYNAGRQLKLQFPTSIEEKALARAEEMRKMSVAAQAQSGIRDAVGMPEDHSPLSSLGISLERSMRIVPGVASQHARGSGRSDQNNFSSTANYEAADEDEAMEE